MSIELDNCIMWNQSKKTCFTEYTLILPDISIGNVGQLTVDLLLNNLDIEHLGRLVHPCFYPFIGSDPIYSDGTALSSSCEIYECTEKKLIILQIRSRVFPKKFQEYKDLLVHFIKQFNFMQTVLVASSSSEYFSAEQLQSVPIHILYTSKFAGKKDLTELNWKEFSLPENVDISIESSIPGSFVSQALFEKCEKEHIPLLIVICVCAEGNNYPEALQVIKCLNSWLFLKQEEDSGETWKMPISWMLPYGSAAPHSIY